MLRGRLNILALVKEKPITINAEKEAKFQTSPDEATIFSLIIHGMSLADVLIYHQKNFYGTFVLF